MSVSCNARLMYGVPVNKDELHEGVTERGCEHDEIKGARFCLTCGKPTHETTKVRIEGYNGYDSLKIEGQGFEVLKTGGDRGDAHFVGVYIGATGDMMYSPEPALIDQKLLDRAVKLCDERSAAFAKLFGGFPGMYLVSCVG